MVFTSNTDTMVIAGFFFFFKINSFKVYLLFSHYIVLVLPSQHLWICSIIIHELPLSSWPWLVDIQSILQCPSHLLHLQRRLSWIPHMMSSPFCIDSIYNFLSPIMASFEQYFFSLLESKALWLTGPHIISLGFYPSHPVRRLAHNQFPTIKHHSFLLLGSMAESVFSPWAYVSTPLSKHLASSSSPDLSLPYPCFLWGLNSPCFFLLSLFLCLELHPCDLPLLHMELPFLLWTLWERLVFSGRVSVVP